MSNSDVDESGVVTAADSGAGTILDYPIEVFVPDGSGGTRSLVLNGRVSGPQTLRRCGNHLIARGICIDCTRAASRLVWAT